MKFGEILAELRQDKGLLQKDLAAIISVSVSTVSNYETGAHFPDVETLLKLADYFEVSIDYLLGRTAFRGDFARLNIEIAPGITASNLLNKVFMYSDENLCSFLDYVSLLELRR